MKICGTDGKNKRYGTRKPLFPLAAAFLNLRLLTQIGVYDGGNSFHGLQEDGRQGL